MKQFINKIWERLKFKPKPMGPPPLGAPKPSKIKNISFAPLLKNAHLQNSLMIIACAYFVADFVATAIKPLIPEFKAPKNYAGQMIKRKSISDYDLILSRNLFNEKGLIPDTDELNTGFGPPVKSTLPLNLTGIIVVKDELKSVASVEDKGSNQVVAVRVNDYINPNALVQKIESTRLIFFNKSSSRREYIELPQDLIQNMLKRKSASAGNGINKESENRYTIERVAVDKALENFNDVLTQARCVPNMDNGHPDGYRCFQIVKGSIYDQLGLQDNDVICGFNGEPLNDISKAFSVLNQLKAKELNSLSICIKRNGRVTTKDYDFR